VPVQFEFIKKLNDRFICKEWLAVQPSKGFIMPGDKCDLALEVHVLKTSAGPLTCGQDQMYDILVLHLVGGKDIFVTVSGNYRKSCFGASIDALCKMTVPIAELSVADLMAYEGFPSKSVKDGDVAEGEKSQNEPYPVPKELWFLCDLITNLGFEADNIFLTPGKRSELLAIRDWLDTGLPVGAPPGVSVHSAAEALVIFLQALRESVVPSGSATRRCLDAAPNYLHAKQAAASELPSRHLAVFQYVTAFLREVLRHAERNGSDPKILAALFGGVLVRGDPGGVPAMGGLRARTQQQLLEQKKTRFVYHFLVNDPADDS